MNGCLNYVFGGLPVKLETKGVWLRGFPNLYVALQLPTVDARANTGGLKSMGPRHHKGFNCLHSRQPVRHHIWI